MRRERSHLHEEVSYPKFWWPSPRDGAVTLPIRWHLPRSVRILRRGEVLRLALPSKATPAFREHQPGGPSFQTLRQNPRRCDRRAQHATLRDPLRTCLHIGRSRTDLPNPLQVRNALRTGRDSTVSRRLAAFDAKRVPPD